MFPGSSRGRGLVTCFWGSPSLDRGLTRGTLGASLTGRPLCVPTSFCSSLRRCSQRAGRRPDRCATQEVAHRLSGSTLAVRDLAVRRHGPILRNNSDALNPEAQCRAVRPCLGGSESRNRLSGTPTWPGFAFLVSGCSQRRTLPMASVLITGTSSGIGMATALAFGRAGHKVAATMRNPHRAPELARIATQEKLPITISAMDVDSDASVKEGIGRIVKEGGPVDVLVNNAGIERIEIGRASCRGRV